MNKEIADKRAVTLFGRNIGALSAEDQVVICNTKIGIAGCGLGSEAARQLAKFGFQIVSLADPDSVEDHNLNRQSYHKSHVGMKKVEALRDKLRLIDPEQDPKLYPNGITEGNFKEFVSEADIIIDGIDPSAIHLSVAMTREAHRQGKTVVTALDMGFGARLFIFVPEGVDVMEFLGFDKHTTDEALKSMPVDKVMAGYMEDMPPYVMGIIGAMMSGAFDYYPQNMLAVAQSGVMIATACKRIALKQPIITAPKYIHVDIDDMLSKIE